MLELAHPGGHPVIASDIFRLLSPVLMIGAYSDVDTRVEHIKQLEKSCLTELPDLLFNIKIERSDHSAIIQSLNTNFIYAKNHEHAVMCAHRKNIYLKYTNLSFISNFDMNMDVTLFDTVMTLESSVIDSFRQFVQEYFSSKISLSATDILEFRQELKNSFPEHFDAYFYFYVISLCGPRSLLHSLFPNYSITPELLEEICNFSLNNAPIMLIDENIDTSSDLSWIEVGVNRLAERNERIDKNVRTIQNFWRNHSSKRGTTLESNTTISSSVT